MIDSVCQDSRLPWVEGFHRGWGGLPSCRCSNPVLSASHRCVLVALGWLRRSLAEGSWRGWTGCRPTGPRGPAPAVTRREPSGPLGPRRAYVCPALLVMPGMGVICQQLDGRQEEFQGSLSSGLVFATCHDSHPETDAGYSCNLVAVTMCLHHAWGLLHLQVQCTP